MRDKAQTYLLNVKSTIIKITKKSGVIAATLFCILLAMSFSSNTKDINEDEDKINGRIKSHTETKYRFNTRNKFFRIKEKYILNSFKKVYDEKGNLIELYDGSLRNKETFKYDENGNKIEWNFYKNYDSLYFSETYQYDEKGNQIALRRICSSLIWNYNKTYKYDENGNQIELYSYNYDGVLTFKETNKYDDNENNIEKINYQSDGSLELKMISKKEYTYNNRGNEIERKVYNSNDSLIYRKYISKYDDNGNLVEQNGYTPNGLYDEKGIKINEDGYNPFLSIYKYTYKYDENGNQIEFISYRYGKLESKETKKYDNKGNQIENCNYESCGLGWCLSIKSTNKYNDSGLLIEKSTYIPELNVDSKTIINYFDKGSRIEFNTYNSNGRLIYSGVNKFTFDKKGNWIKKATTFSNKKQIELKPSIIITERKIEYF